jgi:hypothetical protein
MIYPYWKKAGPTPKAKLKWPVLRFLAEKRKNVVAPDGNSYSIAVNSYIKISSYEVINCKKEG